MLDTQLVRRSVLEEIHGVSHYRDELKFQHLIPEIGDEYITNKGFGEVLGGHFCDSGMVILHALCRKLATRQETDSF